MRGEEADGAPGSPYYVQYTIPHNTISYHTLSYHTIPYHTIPYHIIPYHTWVIMLCTQYILNQYTYMHAYYTICYHNWSLGRLRSLLGKDVKVLGDGYMSD